MGRDDNSHTLLYMGLGALAAVGAGYLAWRYLLSDETKDKARQTAKRYVGRANEMASEAVDVGRDTAKGVAARMR